MGATGERIRRLRFLENFPRENQNGVSATWKAINALCNVTTTEKPLVERPGTKGKRGRIRRYAVYRYRERVSLLLRLPRKSRQTRIQHKHRSYRYSPLLFPLRWLCEQQAGQLFLADMISLLSAKNVENDVCPPSSPPPPLPSLTKFYYALDFLILETCYVYYS